MAFTKKQKGIPWSVLSTSYLEAGHYYYFSANLSRATTGYGSDFQIYTSGIEALYALNDGTKVRYLYRASSSGYESLRFGAYQNYDESNPVIVDDIMVIDLQESFNNIDESITLQKVQELLPCKYYPFVYTKRED